MSVTAQLLRVYQVDKMMRGLQSRLNTAEKFLSIQVKEIEQLDAERKALDATLKQHTAVAADHEGEAKRIEARMIHLRDQMGNAQTNKEYQAFLVELNTFKVEKDRVEVSALEVMAKVDDVKAKIAVLEEKKAQREQVRAVALKDRHERYKEIEGQLNELKAERAGYVVEVAKDTMIMFQRLLDLRGDDAMGAVEIVDRKRYEYNCGACMMAVPIESVNGLLTNGKLTLCSSCQCVMYLTKEDEERLKGGKDKKEPKQSARSRGGDGL